jgi:hypothetical protein
MEGGDEGVVSSHLRMVLKLAVAMMSKFDYLQVGTLVLAHILL